MKDTAVIQPYCGPGATPNDVLVAWNGDPVLIAALVLFGGLLIWRKPGWPSVVAVVALVVAFVSPLCALTASLFSARAVHHLIIAGLAAPALALALPVVRRGAAVWGGLLAAAMIAWHLPGIYGATWRSDAVYWAMQAAVIVPAWAFWSAILCGPVVRMGDVMTVGALAGVMGLLGAVLTFAPRPLYLEHLDAAAMWSTTALADQQLAGLIMWVPGFVPLAAIVFLMARRGWQGGFAT
ncbi:MAG: hypothetical protein DI498_04310 [Paracoccus denitrificans]|nr:MAG: hypothetical protein DI498_04310 [Paracoccus denitrificans]PZO85332.1 MAG: hypothetical protein DI633_04310 [Paracoccus denitrificans]